MRKTYLPKPWIKRLGEKSFWIKSAIIIGVLHIMSGALIVTSMYMDIYFENPMNYFLVGYAINASFYLMYLFGHLLAEGKFPWQMQHK